MDPTKMNFTQQILLAAAFGAVVGLVPLITGVVKKNLKLGALGFIGSTIGGSILGLILSAPIAAFFTYMIVRKGKDQPTEVVVVNENPVDVSVKKDQ